jgi:DNA-binding NtrC family response regulator
MGRRGAIASHVSRTYGIVDNFSDRSYHQAGSVMVKSLEMLLIDDDPSLVPLIAMMIRRFFAERVALTEMTDPVAAKEWIETNAPDLVLTDQQMPEVDGFEILKSAKKRNPYCQVVIYSGHFSDEALCLALRLGATDYVSKTAVPEELLQILDHAHRRVLRWMQALPATTACA